MMIAHHKILYTQPLSKEAPAMSPRRPRRPAQLSAEQTDFIVGTQDIALSCELAHTTAAAVVILPTTAALEADVRERIMHVITTEGIDTLAETWANSPAESLPGLLWRGYLLREWIRRFPHDVNARFNAAHHYQRLHSPVDSEQGTQPHTQAPEGAGSTASAASPVYTPAASPEVSAPTASAPELSAPSVSTPRTIHKLWD